MKAGTITKASELIDALKADRSACLGWTTGSRPSAPGAWTINNTRVYASAVLNANKMGALKCFRNDWQQRLYKLTLKFRMEA